MTMGVIREGPAWIDCLGRSLTATDGRVRCPLDERAVPVTVCLACRHLSATADERNPDRDCQVPSSIDC
jgi:hypothetical protein